MTQTLDLVDWHQEQRCEKAVEALGQNGFTAVYCRSPREAYDYIIKQGSDAATIGFGGSRTVVDLDVQKLFAELGKEILDHGLPGLERRRR